MKKKKCILISGGWDSAACFFKIKNNDQYDLIFIHYNQIYLKNEYKAVKSFLSSLNRTFTVLCFDLKHDEERRNMFFISELKKLGYYEVVVGSRNILPIFDIYKDSNWLSLKLYGYLMNMRIILPIVGWNKKRVVQYVKKHTNNSFYNCYNNLNNQSICTCKNCKEMKVLCL